MPLDTVACTRIAEGPVIQSSRLESHSGESNSSRGAGRSLLVAAWIPHPQEEPLALNFGYLPSSWRSCAPSWHQDATTSLKIFQKTPSWSQHLPTELRKPSQDSLQDPPEEAPNPKKNTTSAVVLFVFTLRSFFQTSQKKVTKNAPSTFPKAAKLTPT